MDKNKLRICQHNVISWSGTRINELSNEYIKEDFDIILMNSHSLIN